MRYQWFIIPIIVLFFACTQNKELDSKVAIDYRGYSDTTVALLYGNITNLEKQPLSNTQIKITNNDYETVSDSTGSFGLYTTSAIYDIYIWHEGYQTVLLKGYESDSDQFTRIDVQLSNKNQDTLTINASKLHEKSNSR